MNFDILVISPEFGYGGIGINTLKIVNFLLGEGFRVCVHTNNSQRIEASHPNLEIVPITSPLLGFEIFNPFFDLFSSLRLRKIKVSLIIRPLSLFYLHAPFFSNVKIPELVIVHDTFVDMINSFNIAGRREVKGKYLASMLGKPLLESERTILHRAKRIVAVSEYTKERLVQNYNIDRKKICVIYNPIDADKFRRKTCEEITSEIANKIRTFKNDKLLALFVGRSEGLASKNTQLFFNIIDSSDNDDLRFVVVGINEKDRYYGKYVQKLKHHEVLFLNYVDNDLMPDVYSLADFLFITSFSENLPTCLLEAMACGVIPISTDVGGIPEIVKDQENGLLIPSNNVKRFLEVTNNLGKSANICFSILSQKAEKSVKEKIDSETAKNRYIKLVDEMISGKI